MPNTQFTKYGFMTVIVLFLACAPKFINKVSPGEERGYIEFVPWEDSDAPFSSMPGANVYTATSDLYLITDDSLRKLQEKEIPEFILTLIVNDETKFFTADRLTDVIRSYLETNLGERSSSLDLAFKYRGDIIKAISPWKRNVHSYCIASDCDTSSMIIKSNSFERDKICFLGGRPRVVVAQTPGMHIYELRDANANGRFFYFEVPIVKDMVTQVKVGTSKRVLGGEDLFYKVGKTYMKATPENMDSYK